MGGRLDPKGQPFPKVFKGPTIDASELKIIQSMKNVIRMGRATSIGRDKILFGDRGSIDFESKSTLLVDCMVDNQYGYVYDENMQIFERDRINLGPITILFNPSMTSAQIAFLEAKLEKEDEKKNSCCYFLRGKDLCTPDPKNFVGAFYLQQKSTEAFMKISGAPKFMFNSRVNSAAPKHHGGFLKFFWKMFGPSQFHKFGKQLVHKVESKGYNDLDQCFGAETFEKKETKKISPLFC